MTNEKVETPANGLIALITDFGNKDYYAGIMKGVIKQINPSAEMIDISHEIASYDLLSASFVVAQSHGFFPSGTIFLVVVDPGVGTERKILLVEHSGRFFIAPNNGVLTPILHKEEKIIYILDNKKYFLVQGNSTFEGRDKMAPAAAYLSQGVELREMATHFPPHLYHSEMIINPDYFPTVSKKGIEGRIVYIDKFGNTITNVNADFLFPAWQASGFTNCKVMINQAEIKTFYKTYGHAGTDSNPFMLIGSHQNLEIASNRQSAALLLNAEIGQKIFIEFY